MKILVISDMHTEFWKGWNTPELPALPDPDMYDLVVAAGDIGLDIKGFEWLEQFFPPNKTVLYVPGNHEYYKGDYFTLQEKLNGLSRLNNSQVIVLNPGRTIIDGVKFIGATMWTDFKLRGYPDEPDFVFENAIADFRVITAGKMSARDYPELFSAVLCRAIYDNELQFIKSELEGTSAEQMKKTVVITHFVPSQLLIDQKWQREGYRRLNPYFTNDTDYELFEYGYPLHIYGHTHDRNDMIHPLGTRMVGHPHGYPDENPNKYEWKIVEV